MRRIVQLFLMVVLALMPFGVSAQSSVTGSAFQVQNLSDTQPANVVITYYNADGTVAATQNQQILAGASATFFNGQGGTIAITAPAGFRGGVVISSDQPIAAITNLVGSNIGEAYSGFGASGGTTVSAPLIVRGNFGDDTALTVQNTGSAATTVNVVYTPGVAGSTGATDTASIPAGSSVTFDQSTKTALGTRFVGSATITATAGGSIVAIVTKSGNSQLSVYNGFNAGAASVSTPLVVSNNFGAFTGIQVQNVGGAAADVVVTYSANSVSGAGTCATPTASTFNLTSLASKTLIQANGSATDGFDPQFATCRYIGGATVTSSTAGASLVAIANFISPPSSSAYEGFLTGSTTNVAKVPLVSSNNFGLFSGVQVQNVGAAPAVVTVTYGANTITTASDPNACPTPTARTVTIANGASATLIQAGGAASDGFDAQFATCRYVGSMTLSAPTGAKIVAIANQLGPSLPGDTQSTYNAFNQ